MPPDPPDTCPPSSRVGSSGGVWEPPAPEALKDCFPQYEIVALLGRGGMAAVYKGWQRSLDRFVAIKILPPGLDDAEGSFAERFKQEARSMAKLMHPGIVAVFDAGETPTGLLYFVMEFIEGTDVAQMMKSQGKLPPEHALAITAHVCDALQYAHTHGIVHRDIKPANIMVNMEGAVKVADFGLAKHSDPAVGGLTKTNMAMGTPDYVAPEALVEGITVDGRADLYAVGVMLYQMLTGNIPRGIFTMPSLMVKTDPRFDMIIAKAMQTDRDQRYASAAMLRRDLDVILTVPLLKAGDAHSSAAIPKQSLPPKPVGKQPQKLQGQPAPAAKPNLKSPIPDSKSKSSTGFYIGIAVALVMIGGMVFLFSGGEKPASEPESTGKTEVAQALPAPKPKTPKPAPTKAAEPPAPFSAPMPTLSAKAVEVLPVVDTASDPDSGDWHKENDGVRMGMRKGPRNSVLPLPLVCKGGYLLEVEFTPTYQDGTMALHLPYSRPDASGHDALTYFLSSTASGTRQGFANFPKLEKGVSLTHQSKTPISKRTRITLRVELKPQDQLSLAAWQDGQPVVGWTGGRTIPLGPDNEWQPKKLEQFAMGTYVGNTVFHRVRVEPLDGEIQWLRDPTAVAKTSPVPMPATTPAPAATDNVDTAPWTNAIALLPLVDEGKDLVKGWTHEGGDLVSGGKHNPALAELPVIPPEEYDLRVRFTKKGGSECLSLVLSRGDLSFVWHGGVYANTMFGFGNYQGTIGAKLKNPTLKIVQSCFETDRAYTVQIAVRKTGVTAYLDGAKISELPADLAEMLPPETLKLKTAGALGIASFKTSYAVHAIELREVTGKAKLLREPTTADLVAQRLAQLEQQFLTAYEQQAGAAHKAAVADLNTKFTAALDRSIATVSKAGKLDEALALRNEKALVETSGAVSEEDAAGTPKTLADLRATYRTTMKGLIATRDKNAAPLHAAYDRALAAYQDELTRAQRLDDAARVKAVRDKSSSGSRQTAEATPAASPTPPADTPKIAAPPKAPASGSSWRRAAEWVLAKGGRVTIDTANGKGRKTITDLSELPSGRFDVLEIDLDMERNPSGITTTLDDEMSALSGLKDVTRLTLAHMPITGTGLVNLSAMKGLTLLHLNGTNVTDASLASISGFTKLTDLRLGGTAITDAGIPHLAPLTNLTNLDLSARGVTGATLNALSGCKDLTELTLGNYKSAETSMTDDGLRVLASAALPKLAKLAIHSGTPTDAGMAHLTGMKLKELSLNRFTVSGAGLKFIVQITTLERLNFGDTRFNDADIAMLPQLKSLTSLNVYIWEITDAGLKVFEGMPALRQLGFSKSKVTQAGREALLKARSNLRL